MQVFVVGSPLETARVLDPLRLRKQCIENRQILAAIRGESKAWFHHPIVLMYKEPNATLWLEMYANILEMYLSGSTDLESADMRAKAITPKFHTAEYIENMKKRLYTKDKEWYKQYAELGESQENWYFVNGIWRIYRNGKLIQQ